MFDVGCRNVILVGRYRSPFTRRVAISLRQLGFSYEHRPITTWTHLLDVRAVNPVGRIPALILDSGEALFDSVAVLDYLDQLAGPGGERGEVEGNKREKGRRARAARGTACRSLRNGRIGEDCGSVVRAYDAST